MPESAQTSLIGKRDTPRVDGPLKVTGLAQYASDFHFPGMLYAVPVEATIANGEITKARHRRRGKDARRARDFSSCETSERFSARLQGKGIEGICIERRPPFEDDVVRYYGQYVALAVADTFESAKAAADAVRVTYDEGETERRDRPQSR